MTNDNGLVDEFENLQNLRKEIDEKLDRIKKELINLAQQKNTDILFGTHKKCSIKEYEKIIYPDDKIKLVNLLKQKGLYDNFSSLNYFKLGPKILRGEVPEEIVNLVKKEKAFRVSLKDIGL